MKKNEVYSEGDISIKFNKFGHAAIKIEKATFLNFSDLVLHDINLKVDFIKYWFGINSIDEVFFRKVVYSLPKNAVTHVDAIIGSDLKVLTQYLYEPLSKINSKSIYIENGALKYQSEIFDFSDIYLNKNAKLLTARARITHKPNAKGSTFSARD